MGRPLRIEYPGALYHVTSRGNERRDIFLDDSDKGKFLDIGESLKGDAWNKQRVHGIFQPQIWSSRTSVSGQI